MHDPTLSLPPGGGSARRQPDPAALSDQLIQLGRHLYDRHWMHAHSGNLSARLGDDRFLITADGVSKGTLRRNDLVTIDAQGHRLNPSDPPPSTELPLHLALYEFYPNVGAVLHSHSITSTIMSRMSQETLVMEGYEMLTALDGIDSHTGRVSLPVFSNYRDFKFLAHWFHRYVVRFPENSGLLIAGHGLYTWGATPADALRQCEALEFMLECELRMAQIAPPQEE